MTPLDRDLARAIDAFAAPPLPADFADRVTAMAMAGQPLAAALPPRRTQRSRWAPQRRVALGLIAGAMMSATAAAAGVFGDIGVTVPALQKIAARMNLVPPPVETRAAARQTAQAAAPEAAADSAPPATDNPPRPPISSEQLEARFAAVDERRALRRTVVTRQVNAAAERRIAQREAAGLPVPTPEQRDAVRTLVQERLAERDAEASARREANRDQLRDYVRERQSSLDADTATIPDVPPLPDAAEPTTAAPDQAVRRPVAIDRPIITPAQREILRQQRLERLERLRRARSQ